MKIHKYVLGVNACKVKVLVHKAGVVPLTKCLAVEWAPHGIRVNSLSLGFTRTELADMAVHMVAQWESLTPMGRMCTPDELVGATLYLASNASRHTTGSDLIVDGGYTAHDGAKN